MSGGAASKEVLILFAHPAFQKSRVNAALAQSVKESDGITLHDLYQTYPELDIDVAREQRLLEASDIVVLQHPFYWYSAPAIVKEWLDLVLEHGWAYGREGNALRGKMLLSAITTGGREEAYRLDGYNRFTMREFLAPFEQTARLCGMDYLPPFVVHGTHTLAHEDIELHAQEYRLLLEALRDGRLDLSAAAAHPRLNTALDAVVSSSGGDDAR